MNFNFTRYQLKINLLIEKTKINIHYEGKYKTFVKVAKYIKNKLTKKSSTINRITYLKDVLIIHEMNEAFERGKDINIEKFLIPLIYSMTSNGYTVDQATFSSISLYQIRNYQTVIFVNNNTKFNELFDVASRYNKSIFIALVDIENIIEEFTIPTLLNRLVSKIENLNNITTDESIKFSANDSYFKRINGILYERDFQIDVNWIDIPKMKFPEIISEDIIKYSTMSVIQAEDLQKIKLFSPIYSKGRNIYEFIKNNSRKNIAIILPALGNAGGIRVAIKHSVFLQEQGYNVSLLNIDTNKSNLDYDINSTTAEKSEYNRNLSFAKIILNNSLKAIPVFSSNTFLISEFHILVATLWNTTNIVKSYSKVKYKVYLVQGFETDFPSLGEIDEKSEINSTYNLCNFIYFTVSPWCVEWLNSSFNKKSLLLPNGIDLNKFIFVKRNWNSKKIIILIEGNFNEYFRNVEESFKIVEGLDPEKFEIHYLSNTITIIKNYRVDKYHYKIPLEKVHEIYSLAHILIKSTLLESFSYPPLEMMATGGVVIVRKIFGNSEFVTNNKTCLVYKDDTDFNDTSTTQEYLVNARNMIQSILLNSKLREELISEGRKEAENRSWELIKPKIVENYEGLK